LTTDLSRISGRFVISRNTAFAYKRKPVDAKQIGRELGVRYVLEGSVRRTGDWVRVNAQLIDAENGAHIWADRIDTDRSRLMETQDEITGRLARTLDLELAEEMDRRIERESRPRLILVISSCGDVRGGIDRCRPPIEQRPNASLNKHWSLTLTLLMLGSAWPGY
jgi:hypothetical protein